MFVDSFTSADSRLFTFVDIQKRSNGRLAGSSDQREDTPDYTRINGQDCSFVEQGTSHVRSADSFGSYLKYVSFHLETNAFCVLA